MLAALFSVVRNIGQDHPIYCFPVGHNPDRVSNRWFKRNLGHLSHLGDLIARSLRPSSCVYFVFSRSTCSLTLVLFLFFCLFFLKTTRTHRDLCFKGIALVLSCILIHVFKIIHNFSPP